MGADLWDSLTFGPSRRRRRMNRQLRQLDRLDRRHGVGAGPSYGAYVPPDTSYSAYASLYGLPGPGDAPLPPVPDLPRRRGSYVVAAVAALAAGGGAMLLVAPEGERLAAAPAVAPGTGSFAFMQEQAGEPVTYNPCEPIRYVVNDELAPDGGAVLLAEALDVVSAATGLVFEDVGPTDEQPRAERPPRDVLRYGAGPSPVLIAWATPEQVPDLAGGVVGVGGSIPEGTGGSSMRYVSGIVYLDAAESAGLLRRADGEAQVRAVIIHELGHLVGLDHVDDAGELMHAENLGNVQLGPGDRQGLAAVGSGSCS